MLPDYFEPSTISLILSWILAIPIFLGIAIRVFMYIIESFDNEMSFLGIIFGISFLIFSPLRYLLFQVILFSSVGVQSGLGFLSILLTSMTLFGPIVFGIIYLISIGAPILILLYIAGVFSKREESKTRTIITVIISPVIFYGGTFLFFLLLPFVGYTTEWMSAKEVIRASNGPTWIYYKYVGSHLMPVQYPPYTEKKVEANDKIKYRSHVAHIYLQQYRHTVFVRKSFPKFYNIYHEMAGSYEFLDFDIEEYIDWDERIETDIDISSQIFAYAGWEELYDAEVLDYISSFSDRINLYPEDKLNKLKDVCNLLINYNNSLNKDWMSSIEEYQKSGKYKFVESQKTKALEEQMIEFKLKDEVNSFRSGLDEVEKFFDSFQDGREEVPEYRIREMKFKMQKMANTQNRDFNKIYKMVFIENL